MGIELEKRSFEAEMRVEGEGKPKIRGYAAVFNALSEELWGFREQIREGAFRNALGDDVRALINHDPNLVLGRNRSGTLHLEENERGLYVEIDPPDTQAARDLMELIRRGDVSQMSFTFTTRTDEWTKNNDDTITRTLVEVERLYDVSVVTYPAYPQTSVSTRCLNMVSEMRSDETGDSGGESAESEQAPDGATDGTSVDADDTGERSAEDGVDSTDATRQKINILRLR